MFHDQKKETNRSLENCEGLRNLALVARYHKIVTKDDAMTQTARRRPKKKFAPRFQIMNTILIEKMTKLKILCLHGANSNNDITQIQLYGLGLTNLAECECLNGRLTANNILKKKQRR